MKTKLTLLTGLAWLGILATSLANPSITNRPTHVTNAIGTTATICVGATGIEPLTYQWREVRSALVYTNIPDATNACLVLTNIQPWITTNNYRVVVCDVEGCVTSSPSAMVYVVEPPFITQQPNNQTVNVASNYTSSVTVTNLIGVLSYQWFFNDAPLPGQAHSNLTILNVQSNHAGDYHVVITNLAGSVTSRVAKLFIYEDHFERVAQPGWTNASCYSWAVAWGDYDGDGYQDLHVCNTTLAEGPYVNFLYRNNGFNTNAGPFTRMTSNEVGELASDLANNYAAAWIDVNNDGRLDLFAGRSPQNTAAGPVASRLYINQGNGHLVSVSAGALTAPRFAFGGSWGDYDNDGWLDFHNLSAWVTSPTRWPIIRTNRLFKGKPDGTFEEISDSVIVTSLTDIGNADSWGDYDNDGDLDLVVANYSSRAFFFQNQGGGRFIRVTNAVSRTTSPLLVPAWGDYDNDGDLDLVMTGNPPTPLFRNEFPNDFAVVSLGDAEALPAWADFDNDGFLDLMLFRGQGVAQRGRLLHNNGDGTFSDVNDALTDMGHWFIGAWGDYDNNGFMDVFACSSVGENALFHNKGNTNHWIKFNLKGTVANGAAIGAKVRVKAIVGGQTLWQMREVRGGTWAQDDLRPNFGLGDATQAETVRVEWPSGIVQSFTNVPGNQILTVTEPWLPCVVQPRGLEVTCGTNVTFSLNATGQVACTYQWLFNDSPLPEATNTTLTLSSVQALQSGVYRAHVSDGTNSGTTPPAVLRVWCGPVVTSQPTNLAVKLGLNATFRVAAESLCPSSLTCQWQFHGTNLPGATNTTLTLSNLSLGDAGPYRAALNDCSGSTVSQTAMLLVTVDPLIVQQPCSVSVVQGGSVTLSVAVTNTATLPILYRWRRGGQTLSNETVLLNERVAFLSLSNLLVTTNFNVVVSNVASTKSSDTAWVTVMADADGDGLPDQWETDYGINQATPNHGAADDDGDGLSNSQEYQCGTDPTNARSYLKVEPITLDGGQSAVVVRFFAVSNKTYTVQCRAAFDSPWNRLVDVAAAPTDRLVEMRDPAVAGGQRLYRLATPRLP